MSPWRQNTLRLKQPSSYSWKTLHLQIITLVSWIPSALLILLPWHMKITSSYFLRKLGKTRACAPCHHHSLFMASRQTQGNVYLRLCLTVVPLTVATFCIFDSLHCSLNSGCDFLVSRFTVSWWDWTFCIDEASEAAVCRIKGKTSSDWNPCEQEESYVWSLTDSNPRLFSVPVTCRYIARPLVAKNRKCLLKGPLDFCWSFSSLVTSFILGSDVM